MEVECELAGPDDNGLPVDSKRNRGHDRASAVHRQCVRPRPPGGRLIGGTQVNLREWIGRSETVTDTVTPTPYAALVGDASTAIPSVRPRERRCRRSGTGCISCRLHRRIGDRAGRAREARRIPAAGAVAAAHVGRQPVRIPRVRYASATRSTRTSTIARRARKRPDAPARWCSSKCATRSARERATPSRRSTEFHDIVYREAPNARRRRAAAAAWRRPTSAWQRKWCRTTCCCSAIRR